MNDFLIFSLGSMLRIDPAPSQRDGYIQIARVLFSFMENNGLLKQNVLNGVDINAGELDVTKSQMTDEGFEWYKRANPKWLRAIDRGTDPGDSKILQQELDLMRSETFHDSG